MKRILLLITVLSMSVVVCHAEKIPKIVKVTVEPKDAAIYINNALTGYGYAEFTRP